MKTNRIVIVQCRLSSSRLPQKVVKILGNKTVLEWVLSSMHKVHADRYFVATDYDSFETIKPLCDKSDFECFAGDLNDVLKRFCDLLKTTKCETVIRATADNPFLFYEAAEESVIDFENRKKNKQACDYLTWTGLPHGSGVEIFNASSLLKAAEETLDAYDHEHVGPALYNHKDEYKCEFVKAPYSYNYPQLRTTIDTYSDFLRAQKIVEFVKEEGPFSAQQIISACNSNFVKHPVVFVPSVTKGHGTGHLHRCLRQACKNSYFVYIPEDKTLQEADSIIAEYLKNGLKQHQIISKLPDETYLPVIITDTFELTLSQINEFKNNQAFISIDEGSESTDYCDYLLDIIPSFQLNRAANFVNYDFIDKPEHVRNESKENQENETSAVLICLGGEDPSGLTNPAVTAIKKCCPDAKITAIMNSAQCEYIDYAGGDNIEFIPPVPNLKEQLYKYDLVVTHYGLTAFEAMYAGCKVILLPTTKLHKKLAEKYNFSYLADKNISEDKMRAAISSKNIYPKLILSSSKAADETELAAFLNTLSNGQKIKCPVCGISPSVPDKVISRNISRTYRRCNCCGIVYMAFTTETNKEYKKAYFFEDYKKQYGKTYQEDFEAIKAQGKRRINAIQSIAGKLSEKNIFDIGCAYGPFMQAAAEAGMNSFGTDISEDAVSFVQHELRFPATVSAFPQIEITSEFGISQFDIVTMWYVIEHFKNLNEVLQKVSEITKKGGIFAFSTPSGEGISCKSDMNNFYKISPSDHYTIWEPSKAYKILKKFGFEVVKIVSTGHHPERFPQIKESGAKPGSLKWKYYESISKVKKLGDTFEIYCKKM